MLASNKLLNAINAFQVTASEIGVKFVTSPQLDHDQRIEPEEIDTSDDISFTIQKPIPKTCEHCKAVHDFPAGMIISNPDNPDFGADEGYKDSKYYCFRCILSMFGIISKMLAVKEERDSQTYRGHFAPPKTGE
tara:strand:+ start:248 stop:649 length:402 start_codon:yes stop_codon:yes gene_type:complete